MSTPRISRRPRIIEASTRPGRRDEREPSEVDPLPPVLENGLDQTGLAPEVVLDGVVVALSCLHADLAQGDTVDARLREQTLAYQQELLARRHGSEDTGVGSRNRGC